MANVNQLVRRKQNLRMAVIALGISAVGAGAWYMSTVKSSGKAAQTQQKAPPPNMTGVVSQTFDKKVSDAAVADIQHTASEAEKKLKAFESRLAKMEQREQDYRAKIEEQENELAILRAEQEAMKENGGPELPAGQPVPSFGTGSSVPPPTAFYQPGGGGEANNLAPVTQYQVTPQPKKGLSSMTVDYGEKSAVSDKPLLTVLNTFRRNGLSMYMPEFMQLRNYLSVFPFMMPEGLWSDICRTNAIQRARASNVANILPVVADNQVCLQGLPIPSYRNQLSFLNLFDRNAGLDTDNNNLSVTGTSGGGKSFLMQGIIRQVLDSGGRAWVFDMGDSYKGLCRNVGGVYLNALDLRFNPFANIKDITASAESIRNLLVVLANPSGNCDDTFMSLLLKAVHEVWLRKKNSARIDDIVHYMRKALEQPEYRDTTTVRSRMDEIIVGLEKYCSWGLYGEYFNSEKPSLDDNVRFSVLEMGELKDKPDLLAAVMFSMMIYVEQRMYLSDRQQHKVCLIDEAWKLLSKDNKRAEDFIENGYRTARKYNGAYITITQGIEDFDGQKASGAAKAAWANSSFKIILRQNRDAFRKYCLDNPDQFNRFEREVIEGFPAAREAHFSSFMLRYGGQVSFHRLLLDPISRVMFSSDGEDFDYREAGLRAGKDIHDIIGELAWRKFPQEMETLTEWIKHNH